MVSCIFCKIVNGDIPSYKIWEDDFFLAFLNVKPFKKGHTLVIPKKHENYIFDLPNEDLTNLILACKKVAEALKKAYKPKSGKISMLTMGLGVPHIHVHLTPLDSEKDVNPNNAYLASEEELKEIQSLLISQFV